MDHNTNTDSCDYALLSEVLRTAQKLYAEDTQFREKDTIADLSDQIGNS